MKSILNLALCAILNGDQLCLLCRRREPYAGYWGLPGGKVHFGETVAEAACREAFEETGLPCSVTRTGETAVEFMRNDHGETLAHFHMTPVLLHTEETHLTEGPEGALQWTPLDTFLRGDFPGLFIPSDRIMLEDLVERTMGRGPRIFNVTCDKSCCRLVSADFS